MMNNSIIDFSQPDPQLNIVTTAGELPSSQTIAKPNVVRSVSEIEERMNFNNQEIEKWRTELRNELKNDRDFRDEGYVSHCRELITDLKSDNNCLRWILGIV